MTSLWQTGDHVNIVSGDGVLLTPTPVKITKVEDQAPLQLQYYRVEGTKTAYPESQVEPGGTLECALYYAARKGWHGFPVIPGRKKPLIKSWQTRATTDPGILRDWWQQWPRANLGIACGPSGLYVVDLDSIVGELVSGSAWNRLQIDSNTVTALTPNDGQHLIYDRGTRKLGNTVGRLGPGIDTRGDGGYIVVHPSTLPAGSYEWEVTQHPFDREPAAMPEALLRLLRTDNGSKPSIPVVGSIAGGERNATLTSLAGTMRYRGMAESEILAALIVANERRCKPPLGRAEVESIAASMMRYEPTVPIDDLGVAELVDAAGPKKKKSGWQWLTLEDAYKPKPPREYVVAGLLPIPSASMFFGAPGVLKSMLLQDMVLCVASGQPWLAGLPDENVAGFVCKQVASMWVDVDNGLDRLERRFAAVGKGLGVDSSAPVLYISFPVPPFIAGQRKSITEILQTIEETDAKLVVFDNLGTISGGADENSSEMVGVMSGLRTIAEQGQCAVIAIHHSNKGETSRMGDKLRGHSSIEGALDLAIMITREGDDDIINVISTKSRDTPMKPFSALWTYEWDGDRELTKGRFFGLGTPDASTLSKQMQAELCITADLQDGMNQSEIVSMVQQNAGISRKVTLAALRRLVNRKELRRAGGVLHGAVVYYHV